MEVIEKPATLEAGVLSELSQEPGFVLLRQESGWRLYHGPARVLLANDPLMLADTLAILDRHVRAGGEAAGFLSYEAGYALEPKLRPLLAAARGGGPLGRFYLYDRACMLPLSSILHDGHDDKDENEELVKQSAPTITRAQYDAALGSIHDLIAAGDVYQINFTYRLTFQWKCSAWRLFTALCQRHPAQYAAFVNTGSEQIVSLSPELFFGIRGRRIVVKPMKGTADRGLMLEDDTRCGQALQASEKNRAENVMIVDLMRNDLGRICRVGSVKVASLFEVERLPSVWQMTSTIEGELRDGCTPDSIVKALFPSGSVTGAPKIRAMEVISELESSERGVYTGAIGYFAPNHAQFNVAIRTAVVRGGQGVMGIGSGITYDSSVPEEWNECESKAALLMRSRSDFKIIETLRWEREYWLLEQHLDRMRASAEYFGFQFPEERVREALRQLAFRLENRPRKVRILLAQNGSFEVEHYDVGAALFGRVRLSTRRVLSTDRLLYHKTTQRKMYNEELEIAKNAQCDDTLLFNEREELTEGTIHNVFLVAGGVWRTPALACGVLAGTYRAYFLKNCPTAREDILTRKDLDCAEAIYLCNSVRGMFPVQVSHVGC